MDFLFQVLFHSSSEVLSSTFPHGTIRYRLLIKLSHDPFRILFDFLKIIQSLIRLLLFYLFIRHY